MVCVLGFRILIPKLLQHLCFLFKLHRNWVFERLVLCWVFQITSFICSYENVYGKRENDIFSTYCPDWEWSCDFCTFDGIRWAVVFFANGKHKKGSIFYLNQTNEKTKLRSKQDQHEISCQSNCSYCANRTRERARQLNEYLNSFCL